MYSHTCEHCGHSKDSPQHELGCPVGRGAAAAEAPQCEETPYQAIQRLTGERDRLVSVDQYRVQLAGCLTAAEGHNYEVPKQGDYGWSVAYQKTLELRRDRDRLKEEIQRLREAAEAEGERVAMAAHELAIEFADCKRQRDRLAVRVKELERQIAAEKTARAGGEPVPSDADRLMLPPLVERATMDAVSAERGRLAARVAELERKQTDLIHDRDGLWEERKHLKGRVAELEKQSARYQRESKEMYHAVCEAAHEEMADLLARERAAREKAEMALSWSDARARALTGDLAREKAAREKAKVDRDRYRTLYEERKVAAYESVLRAEKAEADLLKEKAGHGRTQMQRDAAEKALAAIRKTLETAWEWRKDIVPWQVARYVESALASDTSRG